jgi:DNA-binding CsgD family transcriptional regulator
MPVTGVSEWEGPMAGRMTVSERDLRLMLRLVSTPGDGDSTEPMPWSLLTGLKELIACDSVVVVQLDSLRREQMAGQCFPDDDGVDPKRQAELLQAFWRHYWSSAPCSYPDVSGDLVTVTTASDFYSDRQLRASPMYVDYFSAYGELREMMVCLPSERLRVVRLLFWRGPGSDFSERDRALLTLLRPHLHAAYQRRRRSSTGRAELTARQLELLRLVAAGCTNHQVARRLSITEATVRKHLEHIFARLQVTSRTAAVTRALGHAQDVATSA